jgi:hypothetical protein
MFYNIKDIRIDFVKNYRKEKIMMPINELYNYSIFDEDYVYGKYLNVEYNRKEQLCYIKLKDYDLWLYKNDNNNTSLEYLHKEKNYFDIDQPLVCWIKYDDHPLFIIYVYFDNQTFPYYLTYNDYNITFKWTRDVNNATMFQF